jgi:hypothetical protein
MSTIFTHPAREAHPDLDAAARHRADRLAKASNDQIQAALAYLSMIHRRRPGPRRRPRRRRPHPALRYLRRPGRDLPRVHPQLAPLPRRRRRLGTHQTYDPGHAPEVAWYLPDEDPELF